ncbi:type VII secretion-associated serine protease mycosin [Kitasatospora atroaurantiaca]
MRGMAVLAAGALLWGIGAGPASADNIRDGQWALKNYHAADSVWPVSEGDGVTVAIVDSGVEANHQDLTGQILPGADFSGEKSDGRVDSLGHGTQMASIIAGHGHGDQSGVMGLAPKSKILPVRVALSEAGDLTAGDTNLAPAIRYAVDHGAKVINLSLGGGLRTVPEVRAAVSYAVNKDVVVVGASGNTGNHGDPVGYPAAFPGVVAVGAVDQTGNVWEKSNKGPETTLVAPGVGIYVANSKSASSYGNGFGTSASTAYVSAIAALIRSKYPNLSAGQVINRMIKTAVAPPDGSKAPNNSYGYGIASPSKALAANPAVDNGPKENPLLSRAESQGSSDTPASPSASQTAATPGGNTSGDQAAPAKSDSGGIPVYVYGLIGVVALVVIVGVIVLARRSGGRNGGGPGNPGGPGGPGGYVPPTAPPSYNPGAQQYQQYPPQPQPPYGAQPPQQPPAGNPYR